MKKAPKIAVITLPPKFVGGFTIWCHTMVKELTERGYEVDPVYPPLTLLSKVPVIGYVLSYGFLREKLRKYDLIIGNGIGLTGAIDLDKPIIDSVHSCALAANLALKKSYRKIGLKERKYLHLISSDILGTNPDVFIESLKSKDANIDIDIQIARHANKIITVAPGIAKEMNKLYKIDPEKIKWFYNGIDEFWKKKRKINPIIDNNAVNVVYSGRGGASTLDIFIKGIDRALAVIKNCPKLNSYIIIHVTNPIKRERYIKLLDKLKVKYFMNMPRKQIPAMLRPGDIYIHTSRSESFGLCLAEAMASGLVPVTFATGFAPQLIKNGLNGYIVDTVGEMTEKVKMLARNPDMRAKMSINARETAIKHFSMENMVNGYVQAIEELLSAEKNIK